MRLFLLIIISLSLFIACDTPHAEPEKLDPIYDDLTKEYGKAQSELKATEKELEGFEKELAAVVPQTGQNRYAQKRVNEAKARIGKLTQTQEYWRLRVESRKKWAREKYLAAYKDKKPWPPKEEWDEYVVQRKLEVAPRNWNIRQRLEQAQLGLNLKGEKPVEDPSAAKKDSEH